MPCNCLAWLAVIPVAQDTHYQTTFPYKHEPSQQSKAGQRGWLDKSPRRQPVMCRQLTDSRPTGFLGSSSSQLPWCGPANLYIGNYDKLPKKVVLPDLFGFFFHFWKTLFALSFTSSRNVLPFLSDISHHHMAIKLLWIKVIIIV